MAEFLIRATDSSTQGDMAWKAGDIVEVRPDGFAWGRNCLSNPDNGRALFVLKVPGVTVQQAEKYLEEHWDDLFLARQGRRKFRLRVDELSAAQRNSIRANGFLSATWPQIRGYVENRVTQAREAE